MKIDIRSLSKNSTPVLAAHAMVVAHRNHETLNPAVDEVGEAVPGLTKDQLVLLWIGVNASSIAYKERLTQMSNKIEHMLQLQDALNKKVNPDWKNQGFEWYRAIWVECAELMDHYGWAWWKKQDPDRGQVVLELIDIWHFGLADMLETGYSPEDIASKFADIVPSTISDADPLKTVESFAKKTLDSKLFNASAFARMCAAFNLSFHELYITYVGKNVLNRFRQDHGYKDGSYQKNWNGREDNEVLYDILQNFMDEQKHGYSESVEDCIYTLLRAQYILVK